MSLGDRNTDLQGLDITAASTYTNLGCAIGPASSKSLEEAGTAAGPLMTFMATDGVRGGGWRGEGFCAMEGGMINNMNWGEARLYVYTGTLWLLRQDTL